MLCMYRAKSLMSAWLSQLASIPIWSMVSSCSTELSSSLLISKLASSPNWSIVLPCSRELNSSLLISQLASSGNSFTVFSTTVSKYFWHLGQAGGSLLLSASSLICGDALVADCDVMVNRIGLDIVCTCSQNSPLSTVQDSWWLAEEDGSCDVDDEHATLVSRYKTHN